jgi:hypothetical protein
MDANVTIIHTFLFLIFVITYLIRHMFFSGYDKAASNHGLSISGLNAW